MVVRRYHVFQPVWICRRSSCAATEGKALCTAGRKMFATLAPSERRRCVAWIDFAKKRETKLRRLREAVRLLAAGQKLGLK